MSSTPASRNFESAFDLCQRLSLPFTNLSLLTRALTHRSYVNENPSTEDNERLEFLGDAVLDFTVGARVYHRFPEMPEGDLTKMRSALVRNEGDARPGLHARDKLAGLARQANQLIPGHWDAPGQTARRRLRGRS